MEILSNRFKRFLRRVTEKLLGSFYEGPEPPKRFEQGVRAFAVLNPSATVADWINFASAYSEECYRSGYIRGLEWAERDLERRDPITDPERLLDERRHDWSWVDLAPDEMEMRRIVESDPYETLSPEDRALALDSIGRYLGGYRVQVLPNDDPKKR